MRERRITPFKTPRAFRFSKSSNYKGKKMRKQHNCSRTFIMNSLKNDDSLKDMFLLQLKLQIRLKQLPCNNIKEKEKMTKENVLAIMDELGEILSCINWKHWKKHKKISKHDIQELKYECVDIMHFLMNIYLAWGGTADEFYSMYLDKNKQNHRRQDDGY